MEPNPNPKMGTSKENPLRRGPEFGTIFGTHFWNHKTHICCGVLHEEASASLESLRIAKFQFVRTKTTTIDTTFTDNLQER